MVDWYHYTNPFYMKLKIPIDMKISNVEKKWGKHKMKLLDTEPNELGYILGYSYVIFTIDENDCVKEISFTS